MVECQLQVVGLVERAIKKGFNKYARIIADYPLPFLICPIIITGCLLAGLVRFDYVSDTEYLYTPIDGPAKDERRIMMNNFPHDEEYLFLSTRKLDFDGFLQVILTDLLPTDNVYTERGIEAAILIDNTVKSFHTSGESSGIHFIEICAKWNGTCEENHILELLYWNPIYINNITIKYPINNGVFLGHQLGGVSTDASGSILEAKAIMLTYHVQYLDESMNRRSEIWLDQIKDELFELFENIDDIELVLLTSDSLDQELDKATLEIIPLFSVTYSVLCIFSVLTCIMFDWVRNKMWIALAGQVSAALAIASGIGLVSAIGIPFASICSTMPFLLMGIGIDDMFVIVAAWRDTPIRQSLKNRMGDTFSHAAVSITLTSITDCLAFGIGATSPFRSVNYFCAYAGTACAFCYLYAITFLAACMAYSGKLEEQNRHHASCLVIDPDNAAIEMNKPMTLKKLWCWGSAVHHTTDDNPLQNSDNAEFGEEQEQAKPNPDNTERKTSSYVPEIVVPYVSKLIGYPYAYYLLKPIGKTITCVSYLFYLAVAIYGCTQLQQGLELQNLAPDNSYLADFYDDFNFYFNSEYSGQIMVAITESLDYTDTNDLDKIDNLVESFKNDEHFFSNDDFVEFWLYDYQSFINETGLVVSDMTTFILYLQTTFFMIPGYDRYFIDVDFSDDNSEITASRFSIQAKGVESTTEESDLMLNSRKLAQNSAVDATAYFHAFIYWDQYIVILNVTLINLGIAVASCLVVSFLLVPSFVAVIMVAIAICSICVGVIGFMTLWDVSLDAISMINLVLCIGFSVDFSAHICYHFSASVSTGTNNCNKTGTTKVNSHSLCKESASNVTLNDLSKPRKRQISSSAIDVMSNTDIPVDYPTGSLKAQKALSQLGLPIIQGALSTILAVSILSASNTYIFRTFFKVIFLVMCFGFYHSMIILPVVLALFSDLCSKIPFGKRK